MSLFGRYFAVKKPIFQHDKLKKKNWGEMTKLPFLLWSGILLIKGNFVILHHFFFFFWKVNFIMFKNSFFLLQNPCRTNFYVICSMPCIFSCKWEVQRGILLEHIRNIWDPIIGPSAKIEFNFVFSLILHNKNEIDRMHILKGSCIFTIF